MEIFLFWVFHGGEKNTNLNIFIVTQQKLKILAFQWKAAKKCHRDRHGHKLFNLNISNRSLWAVLKNDDYKISDGWDALHLQDRLKRGGHSQETLRLYHLSVNPGHNDFFSALLHNLASLFGFWLHYDIRAFAPAEDKTCLGHTVAFKESPRCCSIPSEGWTQPPRLSSSIPCTNEGVITPKAAQGNACPGPSGERPIMEFPPLPWAPRSKGSLLICSGLNKLQDLGPT